MASRVVLLLAFALAACGPTPDAEAPVSDPAEPPVVEADTTAPEVMEAILYLAANGLQESTADRTIEPIPFGRDAADAIGDVAEIQGAPAEEGTNEECGAGPLGYATWDGGLMLWTQDGAFIGWALNDRTPAAGLATTQGIGVGSTLADLEAAYAVEVTEGSLGTEFSAEELFGILSGPGPDDTVEAMWAGVSCNFR